MGKNKCGAVKYKGDGNCDDENNNCGCEYDGGDCCVKSLKKPINKKYCKQCKCLDPKNQPGKPDDKNNNCGCEYDGGDCCVKSLKKPINKKYCKQCKCLDPKNQPGKPDDN